MLNTESDKMQQNEEMNTIKSADERFEDAVINDVIEKVPEEDRHEVRKMMSMTMQMGRVMSASPEMELMKRMTPKHIEMFLDGQKEAMTYQFKAERESKIFLGIMVLLFMIFIVVLVTLLIDKPDILEKVLYTMGGLIVGAFGGYGFGKTKKDDE